MAYQLATIADLAQANDGILVYTTLASLTADLAPADGTLARVTRDTTNNGMYVKQGAAGAGSWAPYSYDRVALIEDIVGTPASAAVGDLYVRLRTYSDWTIALAVGYTWAVGYRSERTEKVSAARFDVQIPSAADHLLFNVYRRAADSAYTGAPSTANGDTLLQTQTFARATFATGEDWQTVELAFTPVTVLSTDVLLLEVGARDAGGGNLVLGMGGANATIATNYTRGYFQKSSYQAVSSSLAIAYTVRGVAVTTIAGRAADLETSVASLEQIAGDGLVLQYARTHSSDIWRNLGSGWVIGYRPTQAMTVKGVGADLALPSTLTTLHMALYRRAAGSTYVGAPDTAQGDTLLGTQAFARSTLPSTEDWQAVRLPFDTPRDVTTDDILLVQLTGLDSAGAAAIFGVGTAVGAMSLEYDRGYYYTNAWRTIGAGYSVAYRIFGYLTDQGAPTLTTRVESLEGATDQLDPVTAGLDATARISGLTVDLTGTRIYRAGTWETISGSVTIASEATGYDRYDLIQVHRQTLAPSVVQGTARQTDPEVGIPVASAENVPLYHALLHSGKLELIPIWRWQDVIRMDGEGEYLRLREYNRSCLPKTLSRLYRGLPLTIAGFGDSITAVTHFTDSPMATPDGTTRDLLTYLENYGADYVSSLPAYDHGDGGGAIHTHIGWNWTLKAALEEKYGVTVTYHNHGIGGADTAGALAATWMNAVIASAPHLVVFCFGMNETGSTTTYANAVSIIQQLQAAGAEVLVVGVPRPLSDARVTGWWYTLRALESAAKDTGSAWVPTAYLEAGDNLASVGISSLHVCASNANNHPGVREHAAIGRLLASMF